MWRIYSCGRRRKTTKTRWSEIAIHEEHQNGSCMHRHKLCRNSTERNRTFPCEWSHRSKKTPCGQPHSFLRCRKRRKEEVSTYIDSSTRNPVPVPKRRPVDWPCRIRNQIMKVPVPTRFGRQERRASKVFSWISFWKNRVCNGFCVGWISPFFENEDRTENRVLDIIPEMLVRQGRVDHSGNILG